MNTDLLGDTIEVFSATTDNDEPRRVIARGRVRLLDVVGRVWLEIMTEEDADLARRQYGESVMVGHVVPADLVPALGPALFRIVSRVASFEQNGATNLVGELVEVRSSGEFGMRLGRGRVRLVAPGEWNFAGTQQGSPILWLEVIDAESSWWFQDRGRPQVNELVRVYTGTCDGPVIITVVKGGSDASAPR